MKKNLIKLSVLFLGMIMLVFACTNKEDVENLTLDREEISIEEDNKTEIRILSGSGDYQVVTSNADIIVVTEIYGLITIKALNEGNATITVKDIETGQTKTINVKVHRNNSFIELTTTKSIGETISFSLYAYEKDRTKIWIDFNNNGIKDDGEGNIQFSEDWRIPKYIDYPISNQVIRIYGKVVDFRAKSIAKKNQIEEYNISQNITKIDVSNNPNLEVLACINNQLTSIDVSKNPELEELFLQNNKLTSIDVGKNLELDVLNCANNKLTGVDVSNNSKLIAFSCSHNQLTSLDVSKNPKLLNLYLENNKLTNIDVSKNDDLFRLDCSGNQLSSLDVTNSLRLYKLNCQENKLTSLDVTKNSKLMLLACAKNKLTKLVLPKNNTDFKELYCSMNQLTSLDVSNCSKLSIMWCNKNPNLSCIKVSQEQLNNLNNKVTIWSTPENTTFSVNCNN